MGNYSTDYKFFRLKSHFHTKELEWRIGRQKGKYWEALPYVDARAIQNRLDNVMGPQNWKTEYVFEKDGIVCKLSLRVDGEWITKENGSPETNVEAFKGGISKAFIRAAVDWGIGRYLYDLKDLYAVMVEKDFPGSKWYGPKGKPAFNWIAPMLPFWALSDREKKEHALLVLLREKSDGFKDKDKYADLLKQCNMKSGNDIICLTDKDLEKCLETLKGKK